ncbi:hypothetical protein Hdeb2414_s0006g00190311 [Helianthus debilis subsp. tardiflorus]
MNAYVVAVLDELTALYLHIDVVLKKKDQLDQRGARQICLDGSLCMGFNV